MPHDVKLGCLIEGDEQRDAIHIAVAPVIATVKLYPGQHIGLVLNDSTRATPCNNPIGIVDPFLNVPVYPEQRFWMFLYPQSITSLRHDWTHPAFGVPPCGSKDESEKWLRAYAVSMNPYDSQKWDGEKYVPIPGGEDKAFRLLIEGLRSGEMFAHGTDLHGFFDLSDPEELKRHAENYLGITINWSAFIFSCSC